MRLRNAVRVALNTGGGITFQDALNLNNYESWIVFDEIERYNREAERKYK